MGVWVRERQGGNKVDLLFFFLNYLFILGREGGWEGREEKERN